AAKAYYDGLIKKLRGETEKATSQTSSAFPLWQQLWPLLEKGNQTGAREQIDRNPEGARALYRELLFETFTEQLYGNPPLPFAEAARKFISENDVDSAALEAHLNEWSKEKKLGVGFANAGEGIEQILYFAQLAQLRDSEKDAGKDAPPGSARELTERALELADANGIELASASFSLSLSIYALREKRLDDIEPLLARAEPICAKWNHPVGQFQIPLLRAYAAYAVENWKDAATLFSRAA